MTVLTPLSPAEPGNDRTLGQFRFAAGIAAGCAAAAATLAASGLLIADLEGLRGVLVTAAAALLPLSATALDAAWIARAGLRRGASGRAPPAVGRVAARLRAMIQQLPADLAEAGALLALLAGVGLLMTDGGESAVPAMARSLEILAASSAALLVFTLLVLERHFHTHAAKGWVAAVALRQSARVSLLACTALAASLALPASADMTRRALLLAARVSLAAVALEMGLQATLSLFVRHPVSQPRRLRVPSLVANLLQWPPRPLADLGDSLRDRFGVDLRQTWAFAHIRRALPRTLLATLSLGWILSGVRQIPADQRAVHERFGEPLAVWGPGLHIGLPWPFSRLHYVDFGTIRTVAIGAAVDPAAAVADLDTADGPAPAGAHRLWDVDHVSEKSQVIAREAGERQSFEVVYMDVRFVYRLGLEDKAALAAAYRVAELPALIRSAAGRVLVQDFATRTLEGVLGERRETLSSQIRQRVQAELDALGSGVEILAALIEAVHPPAGAASAYHSVQAALIRADAAIARERGRSAEESSEARLQAAMRRDKSTAAAREGVATAQAAQLRFDAERRAQAAGGLAFVFEHYLRQLAQGLSTARLLVLDHRLDAAGGGPTIDLRTFVPAPATTPP